ncbi:hypothetical protein PSPO01_10739 [Paraphaeosphaeria sporulosa]
MTPMISSPSSYLDPETNEYGVTRFLSLTNSSDEEPGSSHQLPQYQIPRVTNVRFIAFSKPKNTCEHDPNVPLHDGEWGFVDISDDLLSSHQDSSNDIFVPIAADSVESDSSSSSEYASSLEYDSRSSSSSDPPSSSSSINSGYASYASSSSSSGSSFSHEDDAGSDASEAGEGSSGGGGDRKEDKESMRSKAGVEFWP